MKLEIRDGRIGADMSEPNSAFVFSTREAFTGPASVPFRYADIAPVGTEYTDRYSVSADARTLGYILKCAHSCGVEAAPEVVSYAEELKARYEAMQEALVKSWGERDKSAVWRQLKRNGCGGCKNCESYGEDSFWCSACGEELRTENRPTPYAELYHMYNWVPFPSERCPKKYPADAGK